MNNQAKNRTIGLIVLVVIILGPAFFLTHYMGRTGGTTPNAKTHQISVDVGNGQSSDAKNGQAQSLGMSGSQSGNKLKQQAQGPRKKSAQQKIASENNNVTSRTPPVKAHGTSANHSQRPPSQASASVQGAGTSNDTNSNASSRNSSSPQSHTKAVSAHQAQSSSANGGPSNNQTSNASQQSATGSHSQSKSSALEKSRAAAANMASGKGDTHAAKTAKSQGEQSKWAVQVGSFKTRKHAQRLISKLELDGQYKSFYTVGEVNGTNYYRVRVGPFETRNQAEKIKKQLKASGYNPYITHRQS